MGIVKVPMSNSTRCAIPSESQYTFIPLATTPTERIAVLGLLPLTLQTIITHEIVI
ncbi:hypothetical protein LCGC14_1379310 [marine sediment metagenome]|uniref:Uncharacterized protein n=1 Tax=marine sediment metagenome TaxID=412755 RepID=A0A0F9MIH4_9ZZZZ